MGVRRKKLESLRKSITFGSRLHRVIHRRSAPQDPRIQRRLWTHRPVVRLRDRFSPARPGSLAM